jgi:hypothetical protein
VTISFHAMRANLLANATAASLGGLRLRRSMSQGDARPRQPTACLITAVAPDTSTARTPPMTKSATLAIDLPMKALVWQGDQDRV